MKKTSGLTFRIFLIILLGGGGIIAVMSGCAYVGMQSFSDRIARDAARQISDTVAVRFEMASSPIIRRAENLAKYEGLASQWILYSQSVESGKLYEHLGASLLESPSILSIGLLLDPTAWQRTREEVAHAPFAVRSGDTYSLYDLAESGADYLDSGSFTKAMIEKRPMWVEPLIERENEGGSAVSYAYPLEQGVIMCDVSAEWVAGIMQGIGAPFGGVLRILSEEGEEIFSSANEAADGANVVYSNDIPQTGWKLEIAYPAARLTSEAQHVVLRMIAVGGTVLLCALILAALATMPVARSLKNLKKNVDLFSDVSEPFPLTRLGVAGAEIDGLIESLESVSLNFAKRVADAERNLVAKEGERKEFEITSALLKKYLAPPIFEAAKFSVAASSGSPSRMRGAFYDIVPTDRGTVYLAAGEAGGEGVLSVVSICAVLSYLRAVLLNGLKPNIAIKQLGQLLSKCGVGNPVSMLLAEFYPSTGTCIMCSAGYPNAMLARGGEPAAIDLTEGVPLGTDEADCASVIINMNKGDVVLFHGKQLSVDQLSECAALAVRDEASCGEVLESLAATGDDVLLLLRYK